MKDTIKFLTVILLCAIVAVFFLSAVGLIHFKVFAPRYENARRRVFENTKSYVFGVVQDLARYKYEWEKADPVGKRAIENVVRMRFANFDPNKISNSELRIWFRNIIEGR